MVGMASDLKPCSPCPCGSGRQYRVCCFVPAGEVVTVGRKIDMQRRVAGARKEMARQERLTVLAARDGL